MVGLFLTLSLAGVRDRRALAQGGGGTVPGGVTIHVVQRGDTLYSIAMQYGTTVDAIAEANGIADPRYLAVGQRLLIPNANTSTPGALVSVQVRPGDTLDTLLLAHHTTLDSLVSANFISNPTRLYAGQAVTLYEGASQSTDPLPRARHHVRPGENLARIALRYHVTLASLLASNHLASLRPVYPGQLLWIPGTGTDLRDLPLPVTGCTINPLPAVQGNTISVHLTTEGPATLSGTFLGYPVQIVTHDATQHSALFGVHAFAAPGVYPMVLTVTEPGGSQTVLTLLVGVSDGGYSAETIVLGAGQENLLNTEVTEPEWEKVAQIMSTFTAQRYFDGLMGLPSTGAITSQFGTRRAYNSGELNAFHSGTDFAGAPGSPITAPAAGVVVMAETLPVRGNATIIDHGWGVLTGYWHQSETYVKVGDVVAAGQVIGTVGTTGRSTGPHLHWEMWVGGVQVDPMQWVSQPFS